APERKIALGIVSTARQHTRSAYVNVWHSSALTCRGGFGTGNHDLAFHRAGIASASGVTAYVIVAVCLTVAAIILLQRFLQLLAYLDMILQLCKMIGGKRLHFSVLCVVSSVFDQVYCLFVRIFCHFLSVLFVKAGAVQLAQLFHLIEVLAV